MKKSKTSQTDADKLRFKAETKLKERHKATNPHPSEIDVLRLIHELEVHQIELEIQNEELLAAKEKAEESEIRFLQLVENIDECFWLRTDEKMLYISPGFEKIWGIPRQEAYGNPQVFTEKIHPEDKEHVFSILESYQFKTSGYFNQDYRIIREKGDIRWISVKVFPVFDKEGKLIRRAGIAVDITEKIQKHLELVKAKSRAEQSDLLKSAFLANMSHEIRTPMNGILGFTDLLKNTELSGRQQQQYIEIIEKSGARMLNIINDIIDISKIEAGLAKLDLQLSNVNELLEYVYTFFKPEVEAKGMSLKLRITLPEIATNVQTDREKLYAILINLVKNAIKYSENGSIEIGCSKDEKNLNFYVKDNGIGIPAEKHEIIFERFRQAKTEDFLAQQGAGLGLAITKTYVQMLGGKIWVESEVGLGSTFKFTIPYLVPVDTNGQAQKNEKIKFVLKQTKKLVVLIVEDDISSELLLSVLVKSFSQENLFARNGLEAIELAKQRPDIDLILMDMALPKVDGYEATRQIRHFNKNVTIIAQTAYGLSGDREKALKAGCNDFLAKPINQKSLMTLINTHF